MHTIRRLIIDFILIALFCCSLGLSATESIDTKSSIIVSQEMCIDELFQVSGSLNQSVLRTSYIDNGVEVIYEVVVTPSGEAYILKDNLVKVKTLSYTSGDYFSAKLRPTVLEIYQNTTLVFSQAITPTSVYKTASSIIESKLNPVEMDYIDGFCGGNTKCLTTGWGNTGFVSKNALKDGDNGEIKWTVQEINKYKMLGLGAYTTSKRYQDINYAVYQATNKFIIYESGSNKATGPDLKIGDVISIKKASGQIKYYLNNQQIYTSTVSAYQDLHVLGDVHTSGALIQNVEASFTQHHELYTTATVSKLVNKIKWNSLKHYTYDSKYGGIVSTTRSPSALSENYYQNNTEYKLASITPDLSKLFTQENKGREFNVIIGIKAFKEGDYIENEISYDRILSGLSFVGKDDGSQLVYIIENGDIVQEVTKFEEGDHYKIILKDDKLLIGKEDRADKEKIEIYYSKEIDQSEKYLVYQGSESESSPFIDVNIKGFSKANFENYTYQYDGEEQWLKKYQGNIQNVIGKTNQQDITHRIGWHNLNNIKNHTANETVRESIKQLDPNSKAGGESAFRFKPTDEFKVSFNYSGGDYDIGSKSLLSSPLNPFLSGFSIVGGSISLLNNGSSSNATAISSGSNVALIFTGNNSMILQVNGSAIGPAVPLPNAILNLGMNLNQGSLPSLIPVSAALPPATATAQAFMPYASAIIQDNYNITCNAAQATLHLNSGSMPPAMLSVDIINLTSPIPIASFPLNVTSSNTIFTAPLPTVLDIGTYGYMIDGNFIGFFEIFAPAEWDEDPVTNSNASQVDFDINAYNTASQSILTPLGPNAQSISKNTLNLPESFAVRIPITGGHTVVEFFGIGTPSGLFYYEIMPGNGGIQIVNQNTGNSFVANTQGDLILDYLHLGGGNYEEHVSFIPAGNPYGRELKWSDNISLSQGDLSIFLHYLSDVVEGAAMTFCNTSTNPLMVDGDLILQDCGEFEFGDPLHLKIGYNPNTNSCPVFDMSFNIKNLEANTSYTLHRNMFYYDVNSASYIEVYQIPYNQVTLGSWWAVPNLFFLTNSNGESTSLIALNNITSEQLFNQALYIGVRLTGSGSNSPLTYIRLDFSTEDEAVQEVYRKCFNYDVINYDCFLSDFGSIDNQRNYALAQPQTGLGEIDYEWVFTNQPVNGGIGYDLETGCYTVSITHEAGCGLPQKTLQYKMLARTDWQASTSGGIDYTVNSTFSTNQYKESKLLLSGLGEIKSYNKAPIEYTSIIRYRHLYPDFQRDIGFYLEGIASNDFAVLAHISEEDPTTGLSDVSLQLKENGVLQPLISTPIKLEQYQFLDLYISNIPNKIQVLLMQYPEFGQYPGDADELITWIKNDIDIPANGGESYQAYVKHYDIGAKTPNLSVNFCVEPTEPYTALLQRSLHDGRHEVARCISETGNPNCPIPINGPCDPLLDYDILYFKFDEDYYRDIANVELLDFEIRDYENNLHLSSANNLPNSIVKIGDNRYELSMTALNSIHPYYTLIVKNAKNEKRYLRFKK